jgi:hypothetical protein
MNNAEKLCVCLVLVATMAMAPVVVGCDTSEYHTFSFTHSTGTDSPYSVRETISFSFEYPSGYKKIMTYAKNNRAAPIAVRFARATGAFGCVRPADTVFAVNIGWPSRESYDAKEAADRTIAGLGSPELVQERSPTIVAGIPAELLVFGATQMPERAVFFDFDGRIWKIFIYSQSSGADQAKVDFEHIVETFKVFQ